MAEPYKKQKLETFDYTDFIEEVAAPTIDQNEIIQEYKNLIILKNNIFKVNLLLLTEDDESTIDELKNISGQLLPAILEQEERIKQLQKNKEFYFSINRLNSEDIDKLAKGYYEQDRKWYNCKLITIDTEEQEAEVQFIGYQDTHKLHALFIKIQPVPRADAFPVGTQCEAIYPQDGRYYQCSVEKITEEGYHIRFKKFATKEILSIHYLREVKKAQEQQAVSDEFAVPDNLKYLPTDNEQQRLAKKKKIKALKQTFKVQQIDKYSTQAQDKWKQFAQKATTFKQDIGQKADHIYREIAKDK